MTERGAQDECARTLHENEKGEERRKNEKAVPLLLHCSHKKKGGKENVTRPSKEEGNSMMHSVRSVCACGSG